MALGEGTCRPRWPPPPPPCSPTAPRSAAAGLRATLQDGTWDLTGTLTAAGADLTALEQARDTIEVPDPLQVIAITLALAALATLWFTGPAAPARRLMRLGQALACAGVLTAAAVFLARLITGGRLLGTPSSWAQSVTSLVDDLQRNAVDQAVATGLGAALTALVGGVLLTGAGWALLVRPDRMPTPTPTAVRTAAAGVACAALAGVLVVPPVFGPSAPRQCLGSSRLCDLRYDEAAYLTSHNAMSTTADRFIGPLQDPDITTQLNTGVRPSSSTRTAGRAPRTYRRTARFPRVHRRAAAP